MRVPALHAVFFYVRVEGAESAPIGLASHPAVVTHREDVVVQNEDGSVLERRIGQGKPIEFRTRRRGYYSWHAFCKTQYAGNPKLGGEANFLKAHLSLIELLDWIRASGVKVNVRDDTGYAKHRDVDRLLGELRDWDAIIASFVGGLGDATRDGPLSLSAPTRDRPDFEHVEARGGEALKRVMERHSKRKRDGR